LILITTGSVAFLVHEPYFRYLGPILPFICMLLAVMLSIASRLHWVAPAAVFLIWLLTGNFNQYLYQLNHDYYGPMEGISQFLNQYAKPSDTVAIPYGDLPVKFYTKLYVIGGLIEVDYKQAAQADWIVLRKQSIKKADADMKKYLLNHMNRDQYRITRINFPDIPYQNREVPNLHRYKTVTNAPKVKILKKKAK